MDTIAANRCPQCSAPLVEIDLAVGPRHLTMRSCNSCDTRWWDADGTTLDLTCVLDLARC